MKNYSFTHEQLDKMKHCIGFDKSIVTGIKHRKMEAYRNYYTTSNNDYELDNLVDQGLMSKRKFEHGGGSNPQIYFVSDEGFRVLSKLTGIKITEMR